MSRRYISRNPARPFSDAVLVDEKTLYLSGRIGLKPGMDEIPDDVTEEAHLLLTGIRDVLAMAEMTMDDLVSVQIYSPDIGLWGGVQRGVSAVLYGAAAGACVFGLGATVVRGAL